MRFLESLVPLLLSLGSAMAAPGADSTAHALVRRNYTTEYADELVDGTACRDVTVIYARGTGQQGNIGESTDVGPLFFDDLAALVPSFAAQGVNYSANVLGFEEGGDPTGSALMANLATLVCRNQTWLASADGLEDNLADDVSFMPRPTRNVLIPNSSCPGIRKGDSSYIKLPSRSLPTSAILWLLVRSPKKLSLGRRYALHGS